MLAQTKDRAPRGPEREFATSSAQFTLGRAKFLILAKTQKNILLLQRWWIRPPLF